MPAASDHRPALYVAGIGETGPVRADDRSIPEMVHAAVAAALQDAGAEMTDVNAVVTASVDLFDGLTASNVAVTEVVGAVMKPETRISADGLAALVHAACQLWAEAYETVLVVAHCKPSMAPHQPLTSWAMDPIHIQPLGVDFLTCAALQARVVGHSHGTTETHWAATAAARRQAADPIGILPACSMEDVLASPMVASPLRRDMCAPLGDGACAVVLTAQPPAHNRSTVHVRVTGVGHDRDAHAPGDRDLTEWVGLQRAYARACRVAGLVPAQTHFDLIEPSCFYAHEETLVRSIIAPDSAPAISPTGGLFAGAVPVAAGLGRFAAAVRHLRTAPAGTLGLAHGTWGPAGQAHALAILEAAA